MVPGRVSLGSFFPIFGRISTMADTRGFFGGDMPSICDENVSGHVGVKTYQKYQSESFVELQNKMALNFPIKEPQTLNFRSNKIHSRHCNYGKLNYAAAWDSSWRYGILCRSPPPPTIPKQDIKIKGCQEKEEKNRKGKKKSPPDPKYNFPIINLFGGGGGGGGGGMYS